MKANFKKILRVSIIVPIFFIVFSLLYFYTNNQDRSTNLNFKVNSDSVDEYQVFFDVEGNENWEERNSSIQIYDQQKKWKELSYLIPSNFKTIRIDFGKKISNIEIKNIKLSNNSAVKLGKEDILNSIISENQVEYSFNRDILQIKSQGEDPYIVFKFDNNIIGKISGISMIVKIVIVIISILVSAILAKTLFGIKEIYRFIEEIIRNKKLIIDLAKNDFRTKYASSYLGILWGFIQPLITILVYWFVFQVGFRSGDVGDIPFVLWFIAGIVPWFFFSDALSATTNVFLEYSYLVKKVVFKIEILPVVKIISALFVHLFFIGFVFVIMAIYGYYPIISNLQFVYYSICMIVLVFSVGLLSSSVVLFFRDLNQIITIILNVGFWFTPIGWNIDILSDFWAQFFKLNPMYYIVGGYRDAFVNGIYFWQRPYQTLYFWLLCFVMTFVGIKIFKKLKPHFSDVI